MDFWHCVSYHLLVHFRSSAVVLFSVLCKPLLKLINIYTELSGIYTKMNFFLFVFRGPELFKKVQSYNEHHENKRGQNLSLLEVRLSDTYMSSHKSNI